MRKVGNNGSEAYRQLCLVHGTSDHEGSTGLFVQITTYKFGSRVEDVEERLNEFLELVRRVDEANSTDLLLNVGKFGNFDGLRVATEGFLRSRRIYKTTANVNTHEDDSMEVDALSRKGTKGARKVSRQAKKATQARITVSEPQRNVRILIVSVDTVESMDTRQLIAGTNIRSLKAKAKG